MEDIEEF
jgi:hypothetical protein